MQIMRTILCGAVIWTAVAHAQTVPTQPAPRPVAGAIAAHPEWPAAKPDDVKSPQSIIAALSEGISSDGTKPRDWDRVQSLFVPGAGRFIPVRAAKDGSADVTVLTFDEYKARSGTSVFTERPINYQIESFGHITHVYESYGLRHKPEDAEPYARGINSVELIHDGKRYWIVQLQWDTERPDNRIPANLTK